MWWTILHLLGGQPKGGSSTKQQLATLSWTKLCDSDLEPYHRKTQCSSMDNNLSHLPPSMSSRHTSTLHRSSSFYFPSFSLLVSPTEETSILDAWYPRPSATLPCYLSRSQGPKVMLSNTKKGYLYTPIQLYSHLFLWAGVLVYFPVRHFLGEASLGNISSLA